MGTTLTTQSVFTPTLKDLTDITADVEGKTVEIRLGQYGLALSISFDWDGEQCYHHDLTFELGPDGVDHWRCEDCNEGFGDPQDAEVFDPREPRFYVHVEHWGCNLSHHRKA